MDMHVITINRGEVKLSVDGRVMRILGEAMSIPKPEGFAGYVVYKNTIGWEDGDKVSQDETDQVLEFLKADFLNRKLVVYVE